MTHIEKILYFLSELYQSIKPAPVLKYLEEIRSQLRPGDVIAIRSPYVERMVPGYWSHLGIYVGDLNGKSNQVIQARGYGVYPKDLNLFLRAGEAVIMRPKLSPSDIEKVIKKVVGYIGSHYDFKFDFSENTKFVCSELVYVAYKDMLGLETYPLVSFFRNNKVFLPDHTFKKGFDKIWISPGAKVPD
jgi:hypothetical protein